MNTIFNEDCLLTMQRPELAGTVGMVCTSPPYNTSRNNPTDARNVRYDAYADFLPDDEYINWTLRVFQGFDKILCPNGTVAYNLSYSVSKPTLIWEVIAKINAESAFTSVDCIVWKKSTALPNNRSPNRLTRICEFVFIFARKQEVPTFNCNKRVLSHTRVGQPNFQNYYNFIEAPNNDGANPLNQATYSTQLCKELMNYYAIPDFAVYDSFMGTGTTALACLESGRNYIGSELSTAQVDYANNRVAAYQPRLFTF